MASIAAGYIDRSSDALQFTLETRAHAVARAKEKPDACVRAERIPARCRRWKLSRQFVDPVPLPSEIVISTRGIRPVAYRTERIGGHHVHSHRRELDAVHTEDPGEFESLRVNEIVEGGWVFGWVDASLVDARDDDMYRARRVASPSAGCAEAARQQV
jgi:hypothetical protein